MPVKQMILIVVIALLGFTTLLATPPPEVSNVTAAQRTDGSKIVDIWYDLAFSGTADVDVVLEISGDAGSTFTIIPSPDNLSGDIGEGILPGAGKHIVWNAGAEAEIFNAADYMFKVTADYSNTLIFVEGGTFNNGTSDVTISSFYIDKYELKQARYQDVMGVNPSYFAGYLNHPVEQVSWFNAIEYCNRRSMQEGYTPCYSYSTYGTNTNNWPSGWNTVNENHLYVSCDWTANGYRLPTEMEWMFAAKGGNQSQGYTYSGSNTIGNVAWYDSNSGNRTHDVGELAANELGLDDMSGNVWEWLWDIYGSYPNGPQTDPHGATSGSFRVERGGSWYDIASDCAVSRRSYGGAIDTSYGVGIRVCRSTDNFVLVEGGTFNNGTSDVTISSFYIDKYELTQAGYQAVMGVNPSHFAGNPNRPVEQVSWFNAIEYCNRRSMQEGLTPCYNYSTYGTDPSNWPSGWNTAYQNHTNVSCNWSAVGYRLPTEMEWQFAARGGNQTHNYTYSGSNDINAVAWYSSNSFNTTHAVGTKAANELGTFNMSGNVWEWVWDIYGSYPGGSQTDPHGATSGSNRVVRGGSWIDFASYCTVSDRSFSSATSSYGPVGFRCVRVFP